MFTSASSIARKLSLAIVVALLGSFQVSIASATTPEPEDGFYDCATGMKRDDSDWTGFRIESATAYNIDCTGEVVLPEGLTSVGDNAFANAQMTSIIIPSSVTSIGEAAFSGASSLTSITIPEGVTRIGDQTFLYTTSLASVSLPSSLTSIGSEAFYGATALTSINIPSSVNSIGTDVFYENSSLTSITVESGNSTFESVDGVLIYKLENKLLQYPIANTRSSYTVPSSVQKLGWYSFKGATALTSITIPAGVTSIEGGVFTGATALKDIYLLGDAPSVDNGEVFSDIAAGAKAHIAYSATGFGSEPTWNGLTIKRAAPVYTVTYNAAGGSLVASGSFTQGDAIQTAPVSTRSSCNLLGWSTTTNGTVVSFPYTPSADGNITLYAIWSADCHTVTFNSKGGSSVSDDSFVTAGSVAIPYDPTRVGYAFLGWSATDGGTAVTFPYSPGLAEDITLYALWSADSHTVTFDSTGGSSITDGSFTSGGSIDFPAASSSRYFDDSLPEGVMALQNEGVFHLGNEVSTSVSGWVTKVYYYRYADDALHQSASVWSSEGVLLGSKAFVGGTASGWQSVTLDDPVYIAAGQTFIVSVLTPLTPFTVALTEMQSASGPLSFIGLRASAPTDNFVALEGSAEALALVDLQFDVASVPTPTRAGYTFLGWSDTNDGSAVSFPYSPGVTEDITLYALWSANSHTVTFDSKGGSSVTNGSFVTNGSVTAPTAPTRAGYTFSGWRTTAEYIINEGPVSFPYAPGVIEGITLYAVWSANSHTVTFDSKGGSSVDAGVFVTDGYIESPHSNPGRAGYTFLGWSDSDGGSLLSFPYAPGVIEDVTLYAVWSADSHTAFFISEGAYIYYLTYVTDGSLEKPADPVRTGYTFGGWSTTEDGSAVSFPYTPGLMEPITLFAKWSLTNYSVTFNSKGGTTVTAGSFVYGGAVATAPRNPYRSGAIFAGWSDTDGGSAISFPYYPGTDSNVTLYAKWTVLAPLLSTASATTLLPGDLVTIKVSRVNSGCTVTVGWREENSGVSPLSKVIRTDRTTGVFTIATPSTVGRYTLTTNTIGSECSSGAAITLAKAFVVGKTASVVAKVSSSSAFVSKNPAVSVTGTVKSAGVVVASKEVAVSLRRNGVEVATASATTNSAGVFTSSFSGISYLTGDYTAVVTLAADSTYRQTQVTTSKITLR